MLASLGCKECGHRPCSGARFCDQCGNQLVLDEEPIAKPDSAVQDLKMSSLLLHSDFEMVFQRIRDAKRTSKSFSVLFRSIATQEQKQSMELKKALMSLSCLERDSKTLCDFTVHLTSNLEKQGRLSLMFSDSILEEVSTSLNQLRLQLKEHHKNAVDSYSKAVKALASSEAAIQKSRDRLQKVEKQCQSSLVKANDRLNQSLLNVNDDLRKALLARETNLKTLTAIRISILKDWELMEQSKFSILVDRIDKALALQGSLLRQKVALNCDLRKKLATVSMHSDIQCWLDKLAVQTPLQSNANDPSPAALPSPKTETSVECPREERPKTRTPSESAKRLFEWVPQADSQTWPILSPTLSEAKLIALCLYYRSCDLGKQKYCRRDLRVLLSIRESMLDWALLALDQAEHDLIGFFKESSSEQRKLICQIVAGQLTDQTSLTTLQSIIERESDSNRLEGLSLKSLSSFNATTTSIYSFQLALYRALFTAIIVSGEVAYLSEPIDEQSTVPTVFEDWATVMPHLDCFRISSSIKESDHAAIWLHCLRYEILARLPEPVPYRKLDIAEVTSDTTVAVLNHVIKACLSTSAPDTLLSAVIQDFKEWLEAMLSCFFCLWPSSMRLVKSWAAEFLDDGNALQQTLQQAGFCFYHDLRHQATTFNAEFVRAISNDMQWLFSQPDIDSLRSDLEPFCNQMRDLVWADITTKVKEHPETWMALLDAIHNEYLWDVNVAQQLADSQLSSWLQDLESRMPSQIEKMLLIGPRTAISATAPFSSSVIDLFSALNAILDAVERWLPSLSKKNISVSEGTCAKLVTVMSSSICFYLNAILSSSQPPESELDAKAQLRRQQDDYNELISQATVKLNTKAKIMNLTKSVMKLTQRIGDDSHSPTPAPSAAAFPLPVATSARSVQELVVSLNNCRQVLIQTSQINDRLRCLMNVAALNLDFYDRVKSCTSELSRLLADRLVFHDLQHLLNSVYNPSPSQENSFSSLVLKSLDDFMAHIYSSIHEETFKTLPIFQNIVRDVFSSLLTAFLWIIAAGSGDRVYQDIDYSLLNSDLHSIHNLFDSELPEQAKQLMDPVTDHLELMALSSNEILENLNKKKLSKYSVALVLTKRTDQIATSWLKSQTKFFHKPV